MSAEYEKYDYRSGKSDASYIFAKQSSILGHLYSYDIFKNDSNRPFVITNFLKTVPWRKIFLLYSFFTILAPCKNTFTSLVLEVLAFPL